jgi:hypothetical protein
VSIARTSPFIRLGASNKPGAVADRMGPITRWLENFFHSREVDRDPRLKIMCGCLFFYYFLTFYQWWQLAVSLSTAGNKTFDYVPAAIIQNMRWLIVMNAFDTRMYMYALGTLALLGLFSLFYLRSSLSAMGLLAFLLINKTYFYLSDLRLFTNYHHFHLLFSLVFLVSRDKLRFFRGVLAVSYIMSAVVKFTPSWLAGEYFNSFADKAPLLPKISWLATGAGVGVIVMELFGPLTWFTRITWLRRLSYALFILFHIYSGVIIAFWYTSLMLPLVLAAFLRFRRPLQAGYRFARRDVATFGILAMVVLGGVYHYFIPGDVRLSFEGRYFGFFMFDANRQVTFETEIEKGNKLWQMRLFRTFQTSATAVDSDFTTDISCKFWQDGNLRSVFLVEHPIEDEGQIIFNPVYFEKMNDRKYGDPYFYYYYTRELVRRYHPDRVSLRLDDQLNGHPEVVRVLDISDFGKLNPRYSIFKHNDWILLPDTNAPAAYKWR